MINLISMSLCHTLSGTRDTRMFHYRHTLRKMTNVMVVSLFSSMMHTEESFNYDVVIINLSARDHRKHLQLLAENVAVQ